MKLSRTLVAALAVAALVAPPAAAMPLYGPADGGSAAPVPDMRASVAEALAKEREAKQQARTWPAYPTPAKPLPAPLPGPPTWPVNPQVLERPAVAVTDTDDGIDWGAIGIGVVLTFVALGAITVVSRQLRHKQRPRVAT